MIFIWNNISLVVVMFSKYCKRKIQCTLLRQQFRYVMVFDIGIHVPVV